MPEPSNYKTFIVHLASASGRKDQVQDIVKKSPFETEIVDAVDGSKLSKVDINEYYSEISLYSLKYPFALSPGEIGCFLSHRVIWEKIIEQNLSAAFIIEDDVHINNDLFDNTMSLATSHIQTLGYIQFGFREIVDHDSIVQTSKNSQIYQPKLTPLGTVAQLVSHNTAKKLLQITKKIDRPIDGFLQMHWETGVHLACAAPSGVSDRSQYTGGSTLSSKQPFLKKLGRAIKRHKYRSEIRKLSIKNY